MEIFKFFIFIFFVLLVLVSIPTLITIIIYRLVKKRFGKSIAIILSSVVPLLIVFWIGKAVYPGHSFYKSEFNDVTCQILPNSANFQWKGASFPDFHGDYCSAAIIELDGNDYKLLLNYISTNRYLNDTLLIYSTQYDGAVRNLKDILITRKFSRQVQDLYYFIGFCNDGRTVIIHKIKN